MLCTECGSQLRRTCEPITERVRGLSVTVSGIDHYLCDKCGNTVMDIKAAEQLARAQAQKVAKARGLLSGAQIRGVRKRLGLTQRDFEKLLGVSTPTVSRWETGAMLPSKTADTLIRILAEFPDVVSFLLGEGVGATFEGIPASKHVQPLIRYSLSAPSQVLGPQLDREPSQDFCRERGGIQNAALRLAS